MGRELQHCYSMPILHCLDWLYFKCVTNLNSFYNQDSTDSTPGWVGTLLVVSNQWLALAWLGGDYLNIYTSSVSLSGLAGWLHLNDDDEVGVDRITVSQSVSLCLWISRPPAPQFTGSVTPWV